MRVYSCDSKRSLRLLMGGETFETAKEEVRMALYAQEIKKPQQRIIRISIFPEQLAFIATISLQQRDNTVKQSASKNE
jgi:hypothetical protein